MKPVIGMVEMGDSLFRRYMKSKYINALKAEGAEIRLLPWVTTPQQARKALDGCDGLLIPGGADVAPAIYGEAVHEKCGKPHEMRDKAEPLLIAEALRLNMPILGICRGMQMLNAALGGTLWQDIGEMPGSHVKHSRFFARGHAVHSVSTAEGSRLARLCGRTCGVNSIHHQAVNRLAPGFKCTALSEDGITEGIERDGDTLVLAVQWHPEHLYPQDEASKRIFAEFVSACEK